MANIERLKHLQEVLSKVPEGALAMDKWSNSCGTSACAVGWSCMDPNFKDQGLSLSTVKSIFTGDNLLLPSFEGETGWDAVEKFFDLDFRVAELLFCEENYFNDSREVFVRCGELIPNITPEDVIKRIQIVIDNPELNGDNISDLIEEMENV